MVGARMIMNSTVDPSSIIAPSNPGPIWPPLPFGPLDQGPESNRDQQRQQKQLCQAQSRMARYASKPAAKTFNNVVQVMVISNLGGFRGVYHTTSLTLWKRPAQWAKLPMGPGGRIWFDVVTRRPRESS